MSESYYFAPVGYCSSVMGVQLYPTWLHVQIAVRTLVTCNTVYFLWQVVLGGYTDMYALTFYLNYSLLLVNMYLIIRKRSQLEVLHNSILLFTSTLHKHQVRRFALKLMAWYVFACLISIGFSLYRFVTKPINVILSMSIPNFVDVYHNFESRWYHYCYAVLQESVYRSMIRNNWLTLSVILYSYFINALHIAEVSYLTTLKKIVNSKLHVQLIASRHHLTEMRSNVEKVLNHLPLVWFTLLFCSCSGYLKLAKDRILYEHVSKSRDASITGFTSKSWMYSELSVFAIHMVSVVYVLFLIQRLRSTIQIEQLAVARNVLQSTLDEATKAKLIDVILIKYDDQYTGSSLFELDKPFVLRFVGALVSFSIMLSEIDVK